MPGTPGSGWAGRVSLKRDSVPASLDSFGPLAFPDLTESLTDVPKPLLIAPRVSASHLACFNRVYFSFSFLFYQRALTHFTSLASWVPFVQNFSPLFFLLILSFLAFRDGMEARGKSSYLSERCSVLRWPSQAR